MNKAELIESLESRLGSKKAASDALEAVVDAIIREVAKGNKVGITGFGTFEKISRAARTGRNPRTGTTVRIKKTAVPKFKPGTAFKSVVADPRSLPKTGNAGGRASAAGTPAKKTTTKKAAAKKTTAKKATAKKATTKTAAAKKTTAKQAASKTTAAKKTTAKKATTAAAKKTTAKKTVAKKAPAKKAPAKKTTAKKTTAKKTARR
ncbi:HU family DNA-binding protein [Flexivirga sp. ID2601S]|uniref:HU family DNA-binding protein n=1 Tax=Flexivirga aerilata TaxID=1656889 RepID=A0A849AHI2_9MICO|nr:HU family DNA-binding protein [Flexivirga aerilata]NNG40304.1 HU family DNA-binding protein [Flexivirga aerilata]